MAQRGDARNKAEPLLPIEAINLVDHAVNVVVELGASLFDLAVKGNKLIGRTAEFASADWS